MQAWQLNPDTRSLELADLPDPVARRGAVTVRVEAAMVLSYMAEVLTGARGESHPERAFVPGTNAVGTITGIGDGIYHLQVGQRVSLHPHMVARERVRTPAQILMGHVARNGPAAESLQDDWVDGAFAEQVEWPAAQVTPIDALGDLPAAQALALAKLVVPYGGLLRVGLQAGECVAVNGASGFYGAGGVLVAPALGASSVIAVGRNAAALQTLAALDNRVVPFALSGDGEADTEGLRAASQGGVDVALDIVGAASAASTISVMRSLHRGGRMAMMGSCAEPLTINFAEILINDWLIAGQFMYPESAVAQLVRLTAAGQLNLLACQPRSFPLAQLEAAMTHATTMKGLDLTAVVP
ncbi:MAG: zinc-binding dehydrogenase [Pseudomonadota bacterium]